MQVILSALFTYYYLIQHFDTRQFGKCVKMCNGAQELKFTTVSPLPIVFSIDKFTGTSSNNSQYSEPFLAQPFISHNTD